MSTGMAMTIKHVLKNGRAALTLLALSTSVFAGGGHDHSANGDDHQEAPALVYTHYTEIAELFVEFPPLVANEPSTFVAHFTRLDNFQPLTSGVLNVYLKQNGKTKARFRVKQPARKGIFLPAVTPRNTGDYQLLLDIRDEGLHSVHDLGKVTVFASRDQAIVDQSEPEGEISYLKEQQWDNPYAIRQTAVRALRISVPGFGTVKAPADGFAVVRAPSDGYFSSESFINAGEIVALDQSLGSLIPRLGEGADIGNLLVAQERARSQLQLAKADVNRLQGLYDQGAIPEKRLEEAKQALEIAKVELQTARSRLKQRAGDKGAAGIALRAPIGGHVVESSVAPGAFVRAGDALFTLASRDRRWLEIQVPEKYAVNIRQASGAWLEYQNSPVILDQNNGAKTVKVSQQIDPVSRTVSAAIEYPVDFGPALIGSRHAAHLYTGEAQNVLSIPASAIIDDGGQPVVYVQSGGETFSRRIVTLGMRDSQWLQVLTGLRPGEWVVARGAYYVKLASTGGDAIGHGHAH